MKYKFIRDVVDTSNRITELSRILKALVVRVHHGEHARATERYVTGSEAS